jgi:hypothetical protein
MLLPGKIAKQVRKSLAELITRYLDGDASLCNEISENGARGSLTSHTSFYSRILNDISISNTQMAFEIPQTSYIYATKSAAFPGLVKIGRTDSVKQRLISLNTACAPAPHTIVAVAPTFDKTRDEKLAHAYFSDTRQEGEFFKTSEERVLSYFSTHISARYNAELAQKVSQLQGLHI